MNSSELRVDTDMGSGAMWGVLYCKNSGKKMGIW